MLNSNNEEIGGETIKLDDTKDGIYITYIEDIEDENK